MAGELSKYKIGVEITGDDSSFRKTAKASEKASSDLEKKASGDFKKIASNFAGIFSGKAKDTGLGSFIGDVTDGTSALDKFLGPAALVSGAVVGIGAAALGAGAILFDFSKRTAEAGMEIKRFQTLTGLSAESVTALKYAAEAGGKSLETIEEIWESFSELLIEGARGSDNAKERLMRLGVDPKAGMKDLEGTLAKVIKTIGDMPPGLKQNAALMDGFGESGLDMANVIKAMGGDIKGYTKSLRDMGLVLDNDAIRNSEEFDKTLRTLESQIKGVTYTVSKEFMPEVTGALGDVSKYLKDNKGDWQIWGENIAALIRGVRATFSSETAGMIKDGLSLWMKYSPDPVTQLLNQSKNLGYYTGKVLIEKGMISGQKQPEFFDDGTGVSMTKRPLKKFLPDKSNYDWSKSLDKDKKKEKTETQKTNWTSATLAEFTRNQGWNVKLNNGSGAAKSGHNDGSLHYVKKAFDAGLGATNSKSVAQVVSYMENAIKAGIRVVDERVRPKKGAKWSAPHIHTEENDKKASFFNPNLDYGGRLEYLKALDKERLSGKGKSLADALGTVNKEEIGDGAKALADYDKQLTLLGVTTTRGRLEVEILGGKYGDLNAVQLEQLRLNTDIIDAFENQSKASEDYSSFLEKLGGEYNDLKGIVPTYTQQLDKQFQSLTDAGVVLDATSEANARNLALMIDMQAASVKLDEATADMIARRREERDATAEMTAAQHAFNNEIAREKGLKETTYGIVVDDSQLQAAKAEIDAADRAAGPAPALFGKNKKGEFMDGLLGGNGNNLGRFESEADAMKAVYNDLSNTAGAAMGAMIEGGAQLLEQWIMTGEVSGEAIAQMTASIISGVASQAAVKSIFEVAEGLAALANPLTAAQAPLHFAAAKTYGLVALGAVAAGAGIGLAGGLSGKKDKSSKYGDSSQNPSEYFKSDSDDKNMNYLRQSQSGSSQIERQNLMLGERINQFSQAVETFDQKVNSQKTGEVFVSGAKQNPGFITDTVTKELGRNSTAASAMGRRLPGRG